MAIIFAILTNISYELAVSFLGESWEFPVNGRVKQGIYALFLGVFALFYTKTQIFGP